MPQKLSGFGKVGQSATGAITVGVQVLGIDTQEIIGAQEKSNEIKIKVDQDKIDQQTIIKAAISDFQTHLQALQNAAAPLKGPNPFSGVADAFADRTITGYSSTSTPMEGVVDIRQSGTPALGEHTLTIIQLASSDSINSTEILASDDATLLSTLPLWNGAWGTESLVVNGITISIKGTMTLASLAAAINSADASVTASVIAEKVDESYYLNMLRTSTGKPITLSDGKGGQILTALGLAISGESSQSLSLQATIDGGPTLYRSTNTASDIISGISLTFKQANPLAEHRIVVGNAQDSIIAAVDTFIEAFNNITKFYNFHTKADMLTGARDPEAVLNNNSLLRSMRQQIMSTVGGEAYGVEGSGVLKNLGMVGITYDDDGMLTRAPIAGSTDIFMENVTENPSLIRQAFAFMATSSNADFFVTGHNYTVPATVAGNNITLSLSTDAGGEYSATMTVNATLYAATYDSLTQTITGNSGTPLDGITIRYTGVELGVSSNVSSTLVLTDGVMDQLCTYLDAALVAPNGFIFSELDRITSTEKLLQNKLEATERRYAQVLNKTRTDMERTAGVAIKYKTILDGMPASFGGS